MANKLRAEKYLREHFCDAVDIFLYGSTIYSPNPSDIDAVIITEDGDLTLFRGDLPELGESHIVVLGIDELYTINERKDVPVLARPPFSSLTCPHSLIHEHEKGFHKELYCMLSENVLDYVIPRLWIIYPNMEEIPLYPSEVIMFLRKDIGPLAEPKLMRGEKPEYLKKWNENDAWRYTKDILCRNDIKKYLQDNSLLIEDRDDSFLIRLPSQQTDLEEDKRKIYKWRESKLKPAIKTRFGDFSNKPIQVHEGGPLQKCEKA